jgi:histidinol dehydrogenase
MKKVETQNKKIEAAVEQIYQTVATDQDRGIRDLTQKYDGVDLLSSRYVETREKLELPEDFDGLINRTVARISGFHERTGLQPFHLKGVEGAEIEFRVVPYARVGLYVPGGKSPLISTLLMLALPALLAKVPEIVVCTPPNRDGGISPEFARICQILGLRNVFKIGGAQAIAAMAIGTETVPQVDKIFGPGNEYVTEAKRQAQNRPWARAIDMMAGPSELVAVMQRDQNASLVAAELMTQVEHGADSWAIALTDDESCAVAIRESLDESRRFGRLGSAERERITIETLNSVEAVQNRVRELSPEHLALYVRDWRKWEKSIASSGAVFVGGNTSVVFGDYGIGPNHTLPTAGSAVRSSGLSLRDFQRTVSIVTADRPLQKEFIEDVRRLAEIERMPLHAYACSRRLESEVSDEPKRSLVESAFGIG